MKILQIFVLKTPRSRRNRPAHTVELITDWTSRDWTTRSSITHDRANLPVHQLRQD